MIKTVLCFAITIYYTIRSDYTCDTSNSVLFGFHLDCDLSFRAIMNSPVQNHCFGINHKYYSLESESERLIIKGYQKTVKAM